MFISINAIFDEKIFSYCSKDKEDGTPPIPVEEENPLAMDNSIDDTQPKDPEPYQEVIIQQPLGLDHPNPPFPPDAWHASGNTSPWRPPTEPWQPSQRDNGHAESPLYWDSPEDSPEQHPESSTSPAPPSYHTSPTQPSIKRTAQSLQFGQRDETSKFRETVLDSPPLEERETDEQQQAGPSTQVWLPPRQSPYETIPEFHN